MRKIKEVLRLKFAVGLGLRAIARSCSIGLGTVHEYLQRAEACGIDVAAGGGLGRGPSAGDCLVPVVRHGLARRYWRCQTSPTFISSASVIHI